ncbi:hypothetical protein [Georgenia sp. Z1491]|uniref:hypothetical protein n=1 Tax=Georgenia sp. Z1491 TaxID=3416707 RepID=UPI003CE81C88
MSGRRRRVIALSAADRRRLESGEIAHAEDALGAPEPDVDDDAPSAGTASPGPSRADADLLREIPPHFGRI